MMGSHVLSWSSEFVTQGGFLKDSPLSPNPHYQPSLCSLWEGRWDGLLHSFQDSTAKQSDAKNKQTKPPAPPPTKTITIFLLILEQTSTVEQGFALCFIFVWFFLKWISLTVTNAIYRSLKFAIKSCFQNLYAKLAVVKTWLFMSFGFPYQLTYVLMLLNATEYHLVPFPSDSGLAAHERTGNTRNISFCFSGVWLRIQQLCFRRCPKRSRWTPSNSVVHIRPNRELVSLCW